MWSQRYIRPPQKPADPRSQKSEVNRRGSRRPNQLGHPNKDKASTPSADKRIAFSQFRPETEKAKNNPENPVNPVKNKPVAEKTTEDVLLHFGKTTKVARRRYRQFVKNGIDQGKRPEFQGGGLVRSAGGNKAGLLGRKKEERDPPDSPEALDGGRGKGDARILGNGDFVSVILDQADSDWERRQRYQVSLGDVISKVVNGLKINEKDLFSYRRQPRISDARAIICYLGVMELGVKGIHVGKALKISGQSVTRCIDRGKNLLNKGHDVYQYLQ